MLEEHGQARVEQALLGRMRRVHCRRRSGSWLDARPSRRLAADLLDHVLDDVAVLVLRAEHDDLRVRVDLDVVSGRPVEQVVRRAPSPARRSRRSS